MVSIGTSKINRHRVASNRIPKWKGSIDTYCFINFDDRGGMYHY